MTRDGASPRTRRGVSGLSRRSELSIDQPREHGDCGIRIHLPGVDRGLIAREAGDVLAEEIPEIPRPVLVRLATLRLSVPLTQRGVEPSGSLDSLREGGDQAQMEHSGAVAEQNPSATTDDDRLSLFGDHLERFLERGQVAR